MRARFEYPADARENGVDGRIVLKATLTKEGALENFTVVTSAHPALGKEAARVIRTARFAGPALLDGKPIGLCVSIVIQLTLEDK